MKTSMVLRSFLWTILLQAVFGTVTVNPSSTTVAKGSNVTFECDTTAISFNSWVDSNGATIFLSSGAKGPGDKYNNFYLNVNTFALTISNIEVEDEGTYRCTDGNVDSADGILIVEVRSTRTLTVNPNPMNESQECVAECNAVGGRPQETITWYLGGEEQTADVVATNPPNTDPYLTNTRSMYTFTAAARNNNQFLECRIGGHTINDLNGPEVSERLIVYYPPADNAVNITLTRNPENLVVACIVSPTGANPTFSFFHIFQDGRRINDDSPQESSKQIELPTGNITYFRCTAGNDLGSDSSDLAMFDPSSTTTPSPPSTPTPPGPMTSPNPKDDGTTGVKSNVAAIAGGVAGGVCGIILIILVVVLYKKGYCQCGSSDDNKVTPPNKSAPVAAPRSTVQHTTDNPGGDEYAMVTKGPSSKGGDYSDSGRNGKGQDQGVHYADLDLSEKAGHTEQRVPQNKNDVVVYSSILV